MIGRRAEPARIGAGAADDRDLRVDERLDRDGGSGLAGESDGGQQRLGAGVGEADGDAVDRRVGVEGQPGGAGLGDGDLRDQQLRAARPPQADHVAGPDRPRRKAAGDGGGLRIDLAIGEAPLQESPWPAHWGSRRRGPRKSRRAIRRAADAAWRRRAAPRPQPLSVLRPRRRASSGRSASSGRNWGSTRSSRDISAGNPRSSSMRAKADPIPHSG